MTRCPTCGQDFQISRAIEVRGNYLFTRDRSVPIGILEQRIMRCLITGSVEQPALIERVYIGAKRPNGAEGVIRTKVHFLRRLLAVLDWEIRGYGRPPLYHLVDRREQGK